MIEIIVKPLIRTLVSDVVNLTGKFWYDSKKLSFIIMISAHPIDPLVDPEGKVTLGETFIKSEPSRAAENII